MPDATPAFFFAGVHAPLLSVCVCVFVSHLCRYCSHYESTSLLHELILAVGYFCVLNHDNQVISSL